MKVYRTRKDACWNADHRAPAPGNETGAGLERYFCTSITICPS